MTRVTLALVLGLVGSVSAFLPAPAVVRLRSPSKAKLVFEGLCAQNVRPLRPAGVSLRMVAEGDEKREFMAMEHKVAAFRSRRFFVQTAAAGAASLALGAGVVSPVNSPVFAEDAAAALAGGVKGVYSPVYDLGIGKDFNRAPGKLVVLPTPPQKSPSDEKEYRALTLPNGLRVLLASDPKADTAAAALNVRVGHFSDPDDIPGLAHFCEHMLFLGTKKFPNEGDLENYLTTNAGQSNAFTGDEETCYFFTVNQNALKGALDRYSQFFVAPLFTESGVEREINAVNSENAKNLNTDSWRIGQLYKTRNNQQHPIAKFGTGNTATLAQIPKEKGLNIREELLKFYRTYYSANQMTLAVSGREDLDTLEKWVTELFSEVPNKDRPPAEVAYAGKVSPLAPGAQDTALGIVPLKDARSMLITWQLPFTSKQDRQRRLRGKPQNVLGAVVGYEGKGSLASYLKSAGLISSIFAGVVSETSDLETFALVVEFTPEGFKRKDEVISACFSYLSLIKEEGVPQVCYACLTIVNAPHILLLPCRRILQWFLDSVPYVYCIGASKYCMVGVCVVH